MPPKLTQCANCGWVSECHNDGEEMVCRDAFDCLQNMKIDRLRERLRAFRGTQEGDDLSEAIINIIQVERGRSTARAIEHLERAAYRAGLERGAVIAEGCCYGREAAVKIREEMGE